MKFGNELIAQLEREIETLTEAISDRRRRIAEGLTDMDDCFVSQRCEERGINNARNKISLIKNGGCGWFEEYATLDNKLVKTTWCKSKYGYGYVLRAEMPSGEIVWTTASTKKGLAAKGLKKVLCKRPAWFCFTSSGSGIWGAYTGSYEMFPSDWNYATGEAAGNEPLEIKDCD